ncbi:MAG: hypothetical protein IKN04_03295 [Clostridia bacterium]|nr:hypothetical protein [Clostridia bacterium]
MTEWKYDGYVKVHSQDRRHMIEQWDWKCERCGYTIRKPFGNQNMPQGDCPVCAARRDYEAAIEEIEYNMLYEPTYNPEDGSM